MIDGKSFEVVLPHDGSWMISPAATVENGVVDLSCLYSLLAQTFDVQATDR